jgi:hypothetical protein
MPLASGHSTALPPGNNPGLALLVPFTCGNATPLDDFATIIMLLDGKARKGIKGLFTDMWPSWQTGTVHACT